MGKDSAPPPPDYMGAALAQGQASIEAARIAGRLNNPNFRTPLGARQITFGEQLPAGQFNQGAYNEAMARYQRDLEAWRLDPSGRPRPDTDPNKPRMPTREMFMGGFDPDMVQVVETLTPEGQSLFDQQMRLSTAYGNIAEQGLGRIDRAIGTELDVSQLPQVQNINADVFNATSQFAPRQGLPDLQADELTRARVEQALFDRLNPQLQEQRRQREEQLLMQGQGFGGAAFRNAQEDLARQEAEARISAILRGGEELQRQFNIASQTRGQLFGEDLTSYQQNLAAQQARQQAEQIRYGLQEANRNRALQELLLRRQLPLQEINALRTGAQPTLPQFQQYQGQAVQAAPIFDATNAQFQAQLGASNARNAARGQTIGGLMSLGSGLLTGAGAAGGFGALFS